MRQFKPPGFKDPAGEMPTPPSECLFRPVPNLIRRIAALEASLAPGGKVVPIWGMHPDGEPMTDREIENEKIGTAEGRRAG